MSFLESLRQDPQKRDRLFGTVFLVGIFATLPIPVAGLNPTWLIALSLLWVGVGTLAWSAYFKPAWTAALWLGSFFLASFLFWRFRLAVPAMLLLLWVIWQGFRAKRSDSLGKQVALFLIVISSSLPALRVQAQQPEGYPLPNSSNAAPPAASPQAQPVVVTPPTQPLPQPVPQQEQISQPTASPPDIVVTPSADSVKAKKDQDKRDEENKTLTPLKDVKLNGSQRKKRVEAIDDFKRSREELKKSVPKASEVKPEVKNTGPVAPTPEQIMVPKYMLGYTMNDISSCAVIDRVPWKFRPDQRKTRLLVKDYFRFQSQTQFYTWEFFQIMDKQGYISYIMRRPLAGGRYESMIVKDTAYNRVIEDPKRGNKVVESQDLKTLVNRETLVFYHANGATISYLPSSIGNSVLTIQPSSQTGRQLAPIFLRASICDRPVDISDEDSTTKKILTDRKQPTSGGAAGGAAK